MPAQPDSRPVSILARRLANAARATAGAREGATRPTEPSFPPAARCGRVVAVDDDGAPAELCDLPVDHEGWCEDDPAGRIAVLEGLLAATEQQRDRYVGLLARVEVHHLLHLAGLSDLGAATAPDRVESWLDRQGDQLGGQR